MNRMSETILIDRVAAIQKFTDLLEGANIRVLRITGAEKMGKSRLLREYRKLSFENWDSHCALVDLRSKFQSYSDVVFQITQQISSLEFKNFSDVQFQIQSAPKVEIKKSSLLFSAMSVVLPDRQKDNDEYIRHEVISAFCKDLKSANLGFPLVLLFDTFDSASTEIQNWLNEQFISSLIQIPKVFIVLAGRTLPDLPSIWCDTCESYILPPVTLEDHISYCDRLGITVSKEVIRAFHSVFEGTPGLFAEYAPKLKEN